MSARLFDHGIYAQPRSIVVLEHVIVPLLVMREIPVTIEK